jgi:hypothetical protein
MVCLFFDLLHTLHLQIYLKSLKLYKMKLKSINIYHLLMAFIAVSIIISSCNKDNTSISATINQSEISLLEKQLESRIISFREKIDQVRDNPLLKSGSEEMEIDSAIWYIEALANLTYGNAGYESEGFIIDSARIEIPLTNGNIFLEDIQIAYDQIIDSLSQHNARILATNKQLIVADISLKELDNTTATIEITSGFGTDGTTVSGNNYPWYWGWELGRCDGSGTGVGQDAADIIYILANTLIPVPSGNAYYTDASIITIWAYEVPTVTNPYGDYYLFYDYQEVTLEHHCMSTNEISYYVNSLSTIGNLYKPPSKSIIRYFLYDDTAYGSTPNWEDTWHMLHVVKITYGIWHTSSEPPIGL